MNLKSDHGGSLVEQAQTALLSGNRVLMWQKSVALHYLLRACVCLSLSTLSPERENPTLSEPNEGREVETG